MVKGLGPVWGLVWGRVRVPVWGLVWGLVSAWGGALAQVAAAAAAAVAGASHAASTATADCASASFQLLYPHNSLEGRSAAASAA